MLTKHRSQTTESEKISTRAVYDSNMFEFAVYCTNGRHEPIKACPHYLEMLTGSQSSCSSKVAACIPMMDVAEPAASVAYWARGREFGFYMADDDSKQFSDDAQAFYAILIQFVESKEGVPRNPYYQWSGKDLLYVRAALDELSQELRSDFQERFKEYLITKLIAVPRQGSA